MNGRVSLPGKSIRERVVRLAAAVPAAVRRPRSGPKNGPRSGSRNGPRSGSRSGPRSGSRNGRPNRLRRLRPYHPIALTATLALVLTGSADSGIMAAPSFPEPAAAHHAKPAPEQRWASAAGKGHLVRGAGNHTRPTTLRSRYPLRQPGKAAKPKPNKATVVAAKARPVRGFDARSSHEAPARRTAFGTTYTNTDGTETTEVSATPVNYRRPDGVWSAIDPRLAPSASGWHNTADAVDIRYAGRADAPSLASVALDREHAFGFGLDRAAGVAGQAHGSTITYPGVWPGTDLRLDTVGGGIKETLVLRSRSAATSYLFPLRLTGLSARVVGDQVVLTDSDGHARAVIPAGSMADSANTPAGTAAGTPSSDTTAGPATSAGVRYRLVGSGRTTALRVDLDAAWLADPARVYPVLVDPSVATANADSGLVVHGGSSSPGTDSLLVGNDGSAAASYLKFGGLAGQLAHHTIYGVQLQVVNYDAASCKTRSVSVHPVTENWSSGGSYSYPGPSVGSALASRSFAYGYIAFGQSQSACPTRPTLFDLGSGGRKLVQGWADGKPDYGLSLRASATDHTAWKKFAGTGTANPPKLYVTHSPYNAKYTIPNPVPDPPVLQNQAGVVKVSVTNLSAESWTSGNYYLAYRAYNAETGAAVTQQRAANLPGTVARGAKVTLDATIKALPVGRYFLDFTMVHKGGPVFTDEQVPPGRIVLQVFNIPPIFHALFPPNGYQAQTLTPQLWANAVDIDATPGSGLQYKFELCESDADDQPVNCTTTPYQSSPEWTVPAGRLYWSRTYLWRSFVKDANGAETPSDRSALLTSVPQPDITSHVAGAPYGSQDKEFDPQVGNFSTAAVDASAATTGPALTLVRTYNSLDPRRDSPFGAGWTTQYDMALVNDNDGTGNVVVSYPDGQEVRFGRNPDGKYAAPQGRSAQLTFDGTSWKLLDKSGTTYQFSASGRLNRMSDVAGRSVVLTYDLSSGRLAKAQVSNSQTNTAGRKLSFTWSGAHVATVSTDPVNGSALTWNYTYSGDLLTKVCAPGSVCTTYDYTTGSHYRSAVLDDRPEAYYRVGDDSGTAAASQIAVNLGKDAGSYHNVTLAAAGAIAGSGDTAGTFNGTSSYLDLPKGKVKQSRDAAVEVWFKSTATGSGGPLVGYQDKAVGQSSTLGVPLLYQGTDGRLHGQFWTGTIAPISSNTLVNDGKWHHAVLSNLGTTQTLYLDGRSVGTLTGSIGDTTALTYNQVGAGYASTPASWPAWGGTAQRYYTGTIDEVAVYSHPLGPSAVTAHYTYGTTAADQVSTVTLPSGTVSAEVSYSTDTDRVTGYTDRNGGTWTISAPLVYGGDTDLRRGIEVRDPADRAYLYEYDALAGRMVRSGAPLGIGLRDEDKPGYPSPSPTPTPSETCKTPDPGDPEFCTTIPGSADGPVFDGHDLDGMAIRTFSYDDQGFQSVVRNENGDAASMTYDDRGNLSSRKTCRLPDEGDCHTAYYTYPGAATNPFDPRNDMPTETRDARSTSATDNTYRTTYTYGLTGEIATQTNPDGSVTRNAYTTGAEAAYGGGIVPAGLLATSTDPRGAVTRYAYYSNGDLARVTTPAGLVVTYGYDAIGRRASETEVSDAYPAGVTTTYTYDALSRLVSTTEPATTNVVTGVTHQGRTTNSYDVDGNLIKVDAADLTGGDDTRTTTYEYDDHNRLARVTDPEGNETSYGYDRFGNRTSMADANGNEYAYGYTDRNMLAEVRLRDWDGDPSGAGDPGPGDDLVLHSYAYDNAGRMVRDTDAMGHELRYDYYNDDLLHTITLKDFHNPDGSTRDYQVESDSYDGAGNLTQQVTGNGALVTQHTIGTNGQVASTVVDPGTLARRTSFTYDLAGNVTQVKRSGNPSNVPWTLPASPEVVDYTYDLAGNLTRETQTAGAEELVTTHSYDQRGLLTGTTDPRGNVSGADPAAYTTSYSYDQLGRQTRVTMPAVATESGGGAPVTLRPTRTVGYNTFDQPSESADELGNTTRVGYDRAGRPVSTTGPSYTPPGGGTTVTPVSRQRYDGLGNVTESTDPLGNSTTYRYDRLNRLVSRDEPARDNDDRAVWQYTYTRTGDVLTVTDPTGATVRSTYDDLDRPDSVTQVERHPVADNFTTSYGYDDAGNLTVTTSPSGAKTTSTYDSVGELTRLTDPSGVATQYGYDFAGRQVRLSDGLGRTAKTGFDTVGRAVAESDLDSAGATLRTESYDYDEAGNLVTSTDPLGHATSYSYDALNQLVRQVEPVSDTASITTRFGYDAAGDRTRYTDGRGNATIYSYNSLGLPESVIEPATSTQPDPADRTWTATYNEAGDPVKLTSPGGVTRQRSYDAAGRLRTETGSGAESSTAGRTLDYDLAGRLTDASAPGGTDSYTYNDRGAVLTASGPAGDASFGYDADGLLTSRTDASGTSRYSYVKGRLATETDGITGTPQTLSYDGSGQVRTVDYGSGRVRTFGYDNLGRIASDTLRNGTGGTAASIGYGYDLNDNLTRKTTTGTAGAADNTYTYDYAGRLASWTAGGVTTGYSWDDSGNRTKAGTKTASYDERNRLISDSDFTYSYTARGNIATRTSSGFSEQFSFDAFDRLISDDGHTYSYDALDRLATRDATALRYAGQDDQVVSDGTGTYAYGALDELLAVAEGGDKRLAVSDRHGDVVGDFDPADTALAALTDSTGYDPFGTVIASDGDDPNLGYQGEWTDPDTGQVDLGARWYDPSTGAFDSRDDTQYTAGDSILANRYVYAAGDPMDNTDPDGNWPSCGWCHKAVHAVSHAVSSGAKAVYHGVSWAAGHAWSAIKTVGHAISSAAKWVYNKAKSAARWVANKVASAARWVYNKAAAAVQWAKQKAEQIRQAAIARARQITHAAKAAAKWAAQHNSLPAIKAALKPVYSGLKKVVSAAASLPAAVVSTVRDVVHDVAKTVQVVYEKAVEAAGAVVDAVSTAAQAVSEYAQAALPMVAGIAAGLLTTAGCLALTGGAGSAACVVAGFAVGGAVTNALSCPPGRSIAGCAATGAIAGAVAGVVTVATGGAGGGLAATMFSGALASAAADATEQAITTGEVDTTEVVEQGVVGGLTAGLFHGAGKVGGRVRAGRACNSFAAGTAVLMADGTHKPIEDVQVGDKVMATDPTTGETSAKPVTDVIAGTGPKNLVAVTVSTSANDRPDDGSRVGTTADATITATANHPFFVDDRGQPVTHDPAVGGHWATAGALKSGESLDTLDGTDAQVRSTDAWLATTTVYNLAVDDTHTFYVQAGYDDVLVHNCGRKGLDFNDAERQKVYDANSAKNGGQLKCDYCGRDVTRRPSIINGVRQRGLPDDAQIDHVEPKWAGGCGAAHNGCVACRACNRDKWTKTLEDWDDELRDWLDP